MYQCAICSVCVHMLFIIYIIGVCYSTPVSVGVESPDPYSTPVDTVTEPKNCIEHTPIVPEKIYPPVTLQKIIY